MIFVGIFGLIVVGIATLLWLAPYDVEQIGRPVESDWSDQDIDDFTEYFSEFP